ncbi:MAG: methionyl-tRNA formyltransferase [Bacteroidia bacterium]|nr:methionyl-tRNA formyltransferase [Bacteroidia bacterium]MCZ2277461.1 methionyl-tRNA formyltransferase [Bacteroidia bacterium]
MKIIFAGTAEFAVPSLEAIIQNGFEVAGVLTTPDKPAGRGLKLTVSPVKSAAQKHNLRIWQPANLKDANFLNEIYQLKPDLMVVIAFRMMPKALWSIPELGTINLHASLLPQYRGAAPINRAIMNGEKQTGLTTFFINDVIDTGEIILNEKISIGELETAGELHDRMMIAGADLIIRTIKAIESGKIETIRQDTFAGQKDMLQTAPKIFKPDCRIDWNRSADEILNQIRGLSPYPAAYFEIKYPNGKALTLKIYSASKVSESASETGLLKSDGKTFFRISCKDGWIELNEIQPAGKNQMNVKAWLNGLKGIINFSVLK